MVKVIRGIFAVYLGAFLYLSSLSTLYADSDLEETNKLLQTGLTIVQIDQEIARLSIRETDAAAELRQTEKDIDIQGAQVTKTRERVGAVLRAYYMGERQSLWLGIFSAKSFSDMLTIYEYLHTIFQNDRLVLGNYQKSYQELLSTHQRLKDTEQELARVKSNYLTERDRMAALQKTVDDHLAAHPETAALLQARIIDLQAEWKDKVLPVFRMYFSAISDSMQSLPDILLSGENQGKYLKGTRFEISDKDLTDFFRSRNIQLSNLALQFAGGQFIATGTEGEIKATIQGHYTVEENPNRLQFHVDKLQYNGNMLDSTTNQSLENEFNFSFIPGLLFPVLQASSISTDSGLMTITFKIKLK